MGRSELSRATPAGATSCCLPLTPGLAELRRNPHRPPVVHWDDSCPPGRPSPILSRFMPSFQTTRRVEFRDTDAAGIMHFSAFFTMMESVEHEMLRSVGTSVVTRDAAGTISWPRVAARCDYRGAARFEDLLSITLHVSRLGDKSVTFAFRFEHHENLVAEGQITAVCCRIDPDGHLHSIPIPPAIRSALTRYSLPPVAEAPEKPGERPERS
jgi:acyl-CoA thioester hydrolase